MLFNIEQTQTLENYKAFAPVNLIAYFFHLSGCDVKNNF